MNGSLPELGERVNLPEVSQENHPEILKQENLPESINAAGFSANSSTDENDQVTPPFLRIHRGIFYTILAVNALLILILALGVGLGVGLSRQQSGSVSVCLPYVTSFDMVLIRTSIAASASSLSTTANVSATKTPARSTSPDETSTLASGSLMSTIARASATNVPTVLAAQTSSATQSAVTSGTSGITGSSCQTADLTNPQNYTSTAGGRNTTFFERCFHDWPVPMALHSPLTGTVQDIHVEIAYTFQSCMDACAYWNEQQAPPCGAVGYNVNLTQNYNISGGNCYLKNGYGSDTLTEPFVAGAYIVAM